MSQKFLFEELDEVTRDYLIAVRDAEGSGAPGVFAPTTSTMKGCGCIGGPIIIIATLLFTLTNWIDVIYDDPVRVALLQTGGLLVGGWLLVAAMRASAAKGGKKMAGYWVYLDSLHLYEAYREQVTVTPIEDAVEANFTHNYNNNKYQNSVVRILLSGNNVAQVTLNNEQRAEQMVVYLNYLAWARGEGGERATLPPASLGGLAKYVSKHDAEPKDAEGNINLNLVELDITEVPETPTREGRAMPALLPYVFIILAGFGIFFVMSRFINPPLRDDAIYSAVIKEPCEPWFLRLYLIDDRNKLHREAVFDRLGKEYDKVIGQLQNVQVRQGDPKLRTGMVEILTSLKTSESNVVSLKVSEESDRERPGAKERVEKLREGLVGRISEHKSDASAKTFDYLTAEGGILGELAVIAPPVQPPAGMTFPKPRTAVGIQLIEFAQAPDDAKHAHIEVLYKLSPVEKDPRLLKMDVTVEIRSNIEGDPVSTYSASNIVAQAQLDDMVTIILKDRLLFGLVGNTGNVAPK
jgi:hypothetical protein